MPKKTRRNKKRANPRKSRKQRVGKQMRGGFGEWLKNILKPKTHESKIEKPQPDYSIKSLDNIATDQEYETKERMNQIEKNNKETEEKIDKIKSSTEPIKNMNYSENILKKRNLFKENYFLRKNVKLFLCDKEIVTGEVSEVSIIGTESTRLSSLTIKHEDEVEIKYMFAKDGCMSRSDKAISGISFEQNYSYTLDIPKYFHSLEFL
jgi:hypothetical protein